MSLDDNIRRMRRVPFLDCLSTEALRLISFSAETQILRAHDVLFRENEPSDGGFILADGEMQLESMGRAPSRVGADTLIGELALLTPTRHPATAVAATHCTILKVSRSLLQRVLREFPQDAQKLREYLASRAGVLRGEMAQAREKFVD